MAARPKGRRRSLSTPDAGPWVPVRCAHVVQPDRGGSAASSSTCTRCSTPWRRRWATGSASCGATGGSATPSWPSAPGASPPTCTGRAWASAPPRAQPGRPRVRPGPHGAGPLQRERVPRRDAGRLRGPAGPVQRELPLRRRGAALPPQRRPPARRHLPCLPGPDAGRGAAHPGRPARRPAPGGRRVGERPAARRRRLRGGVGGVVARRGAGRPLARRPLHPLHRRHHRHAQGGAVAPARHLHGRHGRPVHGHLGVRHQLRGDHRAARRPAPRSGCCSSPR